MRVSASMKTVKLTEVLDYYDGIQIFAAQDRIGGHYVADMIDTVGDFDRYVVVGVRPDRLEDFRGGRVDLRTLLLETPDGERYITTADGGIDDPLTLEPQQETLANTDHLTDEGYFLEKATPNDDHELQRVLERGRAVAVTGSVEQVKRNTGERGLLTEQGIRTGKTAPGGPGLDGLQIGKRYRFQCRGVSEPDPLSRNEKILYLQRVESS